MTRAFTRQEGLVVGVDVGGTKIAAGLVDGNGEISNQARTPMASGGDEASGLAAVISAIDQQFGNNPEAKSQIRGIGICAPGPLDPATGVILNPPNVPCWRDFPLAASVARAYNIPVKVDNDGNAAALAEARWGAGRGFRNVFCATIGTGIGTGIVFDGRVYHGRTGAAAEGGHMSVDYRGPRCNCGKPGCIETLAAGPAIAKRARARLLADPALGRQMLSLANGKLDDVTSEVVGRAYSVGDPLAKEILIETVDLLSLWLSNIVDLLEPDVIIIGGGVSSMLSPLLHEIRSRLPGFSINSRCREIPVVTARYGEDAGIAGGAALCWDA